MDPDLLARLRTAYDARAAWRDGLAKEPWKLVEREAFLDRLRAAGAIRLLEIGAGTGQDSRFFQDNGFDVVAVDLSTEMVARCRHKGIEAYVRDVAHLGIPAGSFDAVYSFNCLLHVPNRDLPAALSSVRTVLRRGGLFFLGVYGAAESSEGPLDDDEHEPPRFFSFRTDEQLQGYARDRFEVVDFHAVPVREYRFQSLTLRRPAIAD